MLVTSPLRAVVVALTMVSTAGTASCGVVRSNAFCSGVTWNTSLPIEAPDLDAAARADFELALGRLDRSTGGASAFPMCLESWKALQCASKFQKCSRDLPAQKGMDATTCLWRQPFASL